jgi:hypothetical protein
MSRNLNKIASAFAFIIGSMAIFAGGKVLLGIDPGYYVISWVPVYNYTAGLLTVFITTVLIWTNNRFAMPAAITTFSLHALVMIILQTIFRSTVASESIQAMTLRLVIWGIILGMMWAGSRKHMAANAQQKAVLNG